MVSHIIAFGGGEIPCGRWNRTSTPTPRTAKYENKEIFTCSFHRCRVPCCSRPDTRNIPYDEMRLRMWYAHRTSHPTHKERACSGMRLPLTTAKNANSSVATPRLEFAVVCCHRNTITTTTTTHQVSACHVLHQRAHILQMCPKYDLRNSPLR